MMFANLPTPTSMEIAGWILCAFAIAGGINQILKLVERARGEAPKPPNAELAVAVSAMEARVTGVEKQIHETRIEVRGNRDQNEALIAAQTAMFSASMKDLERRLGDKQEAIPDKIVNLLRNTRGLLR